MGRIVGIDLGTTNTAVAVMQDGRPKVIEDDRGYKVLPSVVSARGEGRFIVGQAAASLILTHPDRTVYATKRLIGRRFDSPEVQRAKARLQYEIRPAPDGGVQLRVGEDWMTPAEVAAVVLQVARTIAEKAIGEEVDEAVITVPAYFNHQQRAQTMEAAHIAGLRCERLLNEPTAAALAYGHRKNIERTLVIFDLGGGTFDCSVLRLSGGIYEIPFDCSVLRLSGGIYEILATGGDTYLGGEDFDYRLVDHLADQFQTRTGIDLRGDRAALQRLKDAAERAKCELSFSDKTNIVVPHISPSETLQTALSRQTLEALTTDLIQRCVDIAQRTVGEAGLQLTDVDDVILVGGQTRMPKVRETVSGVFGREPSRTVHPEEAVAIGASVHAASLADPDQPQAVLLDVTPFDLGIDSAGGMFSSIVTKNSRIPCAESRTFATVNDNQTQVRVTVRQGESRTAVENEFLGEFVMENLQPAPRLQTKVDVTFRIDNNGMLAVTATERATNHRAQITVRNYAERANQPRMPSREEVEAEKESRAKWSAATEVAPTEGGKKKSGLLSSLFGGGKKQKAEKTAPVAAAAAVAAAVPVAAAAAGAAGATPPPASPDPTPLPPDPGPPAAFAPPPAIDLSDIPVAGLEDVTDMATDAPVAGAAPLDDDDLFEMTEGPVQFGLAGGGSAGGGFAGGFDEVLDSNDLFAGMESTLDPHSVGGREPTDPFGRTPFDDAGQTDPFARPPSAATPGDAPSLYLPGAVADEPSPDDDFGILEEEPEPTAFPAKIRRDVPPPPMVQPQGLLFHGVDDVAPTETADAPADLGGLFDLPSDTGRRLPPPVDKDELDLGSLEDLFDSGTSSERPPMRFAAEGPPDPTHAGDEDAAVALGFAEPERPPTRVVSAPLGIPPIAEEVSSSRAPIITARKPKKPARLKLHYREREAFVTEYRDNLRRGGTFIRTDKPLAVGRECVFEIDAPGLTEPIVFGAVVSAISAGGDGTPPGMTIEYRMDPVQRDHIERVLARI